MHLLVDLFSSPPSLTRSLPRAARAFFRLDATRTPGLRSDRIPRASRSVRVPWARPVQHMAKLARAFRNVAIGELMRPRDESIDD